MCNVITCFSNDEVLIFEIKLILNLNNAKKKELLRTHCVKSVRIRSYSGPYFPAFRLKTDILCISPYSVRMQENTDQNNFEYGHFSRSKNYWRMKIGASDCYRKKLVSLLCKKGLQNYLLTIISLFLFKITLQYLTSNLSSRFWNKKISTSFARIVTLYQP